MRAGIRVTIVDEETGDTETGLIGDGPAGYVIVTGPGCYIAHKAIHGNGTVQVTIKPVPRDQRP